MEQLEASRSPLHFPNEKKSTEAIPGKLGGQRIILIPSPLLERMDVGWGMGWNIVPVQKPVLGQQSWTFRLNNRLGLRQSLLDVGSLIVLLPGFLNSGCEATMASAVLLVILFVFFIFSSFYEGIYLGVRHIFVPRRALRQWFYSPYTFATLTSAAAKSCTSVAASTGK
jgi:hypothetical protein